MKGFRVWSEYWKKYATEAELYMDGYVDAIFEDDDGVPHHENTDLVLEFDSGIKDKNGKEIHEGDILRWEHYYAVTGEHKEYTERVYWEEKDACYVVGDWFEPLGSLVYEDATELIGNIHENQDLLGDTNVTNKEE